MAFNSSDYRKRVVKEYAAAKRQQLADALRELNAATEPTIPRRLDLENFYDIASGLSNDAIAEQVKAVANDLNNLANMGVGTLKVTGNSMLTVHRRLETLFPDLPTKAFWDRLQSQRKHANEQRLEEFSRVAVAHFGPLGVVTETRLRQLARAWNIPDTTSDADLKAKITAAGGGVVAALPVVSVSTQLVKEIGDGLKMTSCRSVLSAIFLKSGEPKTFSVLDGFKSADSPGLKLTLDAVVESHKRSQVMADTDETSAIGKVLTAIKSTVGSDQELSELVVVHFIEIGRQIARDIQLELQALNEFTERTGIDRADAVRILVHVIDGKGQEPGGYPEVRTKVAEGALKAARRVYEVTFASTNKTESTEQKRALDALTAAEERVERLRTIARDAVAAGDVEAARRALGEALTICTDDPTLEEISRRLPPSAPLRLVATSVDDGQQVRLNWEPGFGDTSDVRYQVVRKIGAVPANNRDGVEVANALLEPTFVDTKPPVAAMLYYGVSATRGDGFSPASTASIQVLPPVRDVQISSDPSSVSLRWTAPAGARAVEVVQVAPDGTTRRVPIGMQSGATSSGLTMGATYTYLITAVYTGPDGAELKSETVRKTAVPRGEAGVVASFSLADRTGGNSTPEVEATWPAIAGYPVEVWHFAQRPAWPLRSRVPMADIRSRGTQLAGRETGGGSLQGVRGPAGTGLRYYVAITRDGDEALVGQVQPFGICPPVSDVVPERFNDEVRLRWIWPGPDYDVLVRWSGASGSGERTVARSDYLKEGCRIHIGTGGAVFTLSTIAGEADGQWASTETTVEVLPAAAVVRWEIEFHRRLFLAPRSATLRFSGTGVGSVDVVVVGAHARTMPHDATQGTVLAKARVNPGANPTLDVTLPRGDGPLWVRAFLKTIGPSLHDPPPSKMKVQ